MSGRCVRTPHPHSSLSGAADAGFKAFARPGNGDNSAMIRERAVGETDLGAGPLQQGAGDKNPEPEAALAAPAVAGRPAGEVGFADSLQEVGRDTGTVVGADDGALLHAPP